MFCKDCEYWTDLEENETIKRAGVKRCEKVKMFWNCIKWMDTEDDYERVFVGDKDKDKAFVQDSGDYHAELLTLADFGCNQFKEKTNTPGVMQNHRSA